MENSNKVPCNVGDTVYLIDCKTPRFGEKQIKELLYINKAKVTKIYRVPEDNVDAVLTLSNGLSFGISAEHFGVLVFLNEEEAKDALGQLNERQEAAV